MDLNNAIQEFREENQVSRCAFAIDLNEVPSSIQETPSLFPSALGHALTANQVSEQADSPFLCRTCGKPESSGLVIVCDGCEHGFHMACSGIPEDRRLSMFDDWLCVDCVRNCVGSQRWRLGVVSHSSPPSCFYSGSHGARLLDINALPTSDGEGEATEEWLVSRKYFPSDEASTRKPQGFHLTHLNSSCTRNGFGVQSTYESRQAANILSKDITHRSRENGACFKEPCISPKKHVFHSNNKNHSISFSSQSLNETLLKALRDYIFQRNGVLEDGWHVETRQSKMNLELYVIYVSPDGQKFESACEVACYLGFPNDPIVKTQSFPTLQPLCFSRRKKPKRGQISYGIIENREALGCSISSNTSSGSQSMEYFFSHLDSNGKITKSKDAPSCVTNLLPCSNGLPIQFHDFCIISLGSIDSRPSYHDANHIWPVGYKSSWHDKVTGSLFISEVLDGGNTGPIFRVSRYCCSAFSIPEGLTVLIQHGHHSKRPIHDIVSSHDDSNGEIDVNMIFSDTCPPVENDILSCLGYGTSEVSDNHITSSFQARIFSNERPKSPLNEYLDVGKGIGEFSFEGCSPSLVWKLMTKNVIAACSQLFWRTENLRLFCEHSHNDPHFPYNEFTPEKIPFDLNALSKFRSSACVSIIPSVISSTDVESFNILVKWMDEDRSGLDMEFVQEFIEQVPGVDGCSQYEYVDKRMSATSITVGNGKLYSVDDDQHDQGKSVEGCKEAIKEMPEMPSVHKENLQRPPPPPGKKLCEKLPIGLVGDVVQISELLWRFHEVLGLDQPLLLEELEKELISSYYSPTLFSPNFQQESNGTHGIKVVETNENGGGGCPFPFLKESSKMVIDDENGAFDEKIQSKLVSDRLYSCTGVTLTKVHKAFLNVLVSEFQSKVAALVDPNFDIGDAKTRRGKKKDVDNLPSKQTKLQTLPINELTWPEIARRYILAFVAVDGNSDLADNVSRESGKLLRCLQGDGGVLCGSLTGVAGMEADALLLAESIKQIFGSFTSQNIIVADEQEHDESQTCEKVDGRADDSMPEWAEVLEPVKRLPTNVGTRIRKCVNDALALNPPEWARIILMHSISKEVYKGNASGPTKKAVISVLEQVSGVAPRQKSDKQRKKKKAIDTSHSIMKKCRHVLRMAVSADEDKVFCNLLGKKLSNSCDNDDGGVFGCPGITSRPIDFRTIDLRLAVGAYGGSHEAFLEDVRELWNGLYTAYADQPELFELAQTLSQNFESLYNKDVLSFVEKLQNVKLEVPSVEEKELNALLHVDEMPKAPWDDGVCKICGIDKDDDSVLLCDTCDAEYHTYCLNPPLARIPEGNWYCPSCITATLVDIPNMDPQVIAQCQNKEYEGNSTHINPDALRHFAGIIEEKEYWEFSLSERIFLLKFLSDELLSSLLVRLHLEQCGELSSELLQKLRSIYNECKHLKFKEELLAFRASKVDSNFTSYGNDKGLPLNSDTGDTNTLTDIVCDDFPVSLSCQEEVYCPKFIKKTPVDCPADDADAKVACHKPSDSLDALRDDNGNIDTNGQEAYVYSGLDSIGSGQPFSSNEHVTSQFSCQGDVDMNNERTRMEMERDDHPTPVSNMLKTYIRSESKSSNTSEQVVPASEEDLKLEISAVKNDMSILQDSIVDMESRLLKLSVRREYLGSDSSGRLYWIFENPAYNPFIMVEGTVEMENVEFKNKSLMESIGNSTASFISYQSDSQIQELVEWLKDDDVKEKELKDAILHWQKMKIQDIKHSRHLNCTEPQTSDNITTDFPFGCLVTKATEVLKRKCASFSEAENNDEKIFRCECLEPIFSSRFHCFTCHKTFENDLELQKHNGGKCSLMASNIYKSKENVSLITEQTNAVVSMKDYSKTNEPSGSGSLNMTSVLITFQNEGPTCPFNFEEICSKFTTRDSNRDLVQEVGLISSGGVPLFIPVSSLHSSLTKILIHPDKDEVFIHDRGEADEIRENRNSCHVDDIPCTSMGSVDADRIFRTERVVFGSPENIKVSRSAETRIGHYCVIPHSSSRRLVGRADHILRCLKSNLLDMDAALPIEAIRPSKVRIERRWAWRVFTKASKSIFEMVLATIAMEDMLKSEHLMKWWWHWSSYSAAAKTATLSSLALRISSLDSAIIYDKVSPPTSAPPPPNLDAADRPRPGRRPGKRKRDTES